MNSKNFVKKNLKQETIQKMIEEKNELAQKLDELKSLYQTQDEECSQFQKLNDELRTKILDLANKNQEILTQLDNLQADLNDSKLKYTDRVTQSDADKSNYESQINDLAENEKKLTAQVNFNRFLIN